MGSSSLERERNNGSTDKTDIAVEPTTQGQRDVEPHAAGSVVADPDSLDRVGGAIGDLGSAREIAPLDSSLLSDKVVGHAGLASALREFAEVWQQRLREVAGHTTAIGADLRQTARLYRDTDDSAAQDFADLDPDRRPGAPG